MEKIILQQIKQFIEKKQDDAGMEKLRKTPYVEGYRACCGDIKGIIDLAESLKAGQ